MIELPEAPKLRGTPEEQLKIVEKFLIELVESLGIQLNNLNFDSFDEETRKKIGG